MVVSTCFEFCDQSEALAIALAQVVTDRNGGQVGITINRDQNQRGGVPPTGAPLQTLGLWKPNLRIVEAPVH